MNVTITPTLLRGTITPPPSKSQAHRLIISAALSDGVCRLSNVELSQDIQATLRCMRTLNADASSDGTVIRGCNLVDGFEVPPPEIMDCGESGSTLRFLIPVALALQGGGKFTGHGRLMERPQGPYFDLFREKGIAWSLEDGVLTVSGKLTPGEYRLPGDVSSQFVTGLLYALPLLEGEPLSGGIGVPVLGRAGAGPVQPPPPDLPRRYAVSISVSHAPDLVPPLAAWGALSPGCDLKLKNAARLRMKESDRLSTVTEVLSALGADIEEQADALVIRGKAKLPGGVTVSGHNDHRIAMMAAIAATRCEKPVTITGAECVKKSYPRFWEDYERLGGQLTRA